jgi:hypothetical protein
MWCEGGPRRGAAAIGAGRMAEGGGGAREGRGAGSSSNRDAKVGRAGQQAAAASPSEKGDALVLSATDRSTFLSLGRLFFPEGTFSLSDCRVCAGVSGVGLFY